MNKKKKILLLASVGAAFAIVGGTVAAYVITDNANPIGSKISPSEIHDEETGNITLEWGENSIANVENLGVGASAKVGNVVLKASGTGADGKTAIESYSGSLDVMLTDLTAYEGTPAHKLIDYLEVDIYSGNVTEKPTETTNRVGHIPPEPGTYKTSITATGTPAGTAYSVFVTLSEDATPYYSEISSHIVYLQFDWNKNATDANLAETTSINFVAPSGWEAPIKVYAWKGNQQISAFPGEVMTAVGSGMYSYELSGNATNATYEKVIFSDKNGKQTVDVDLDYAKTYYIGGSANAEGKYACSSQTEAPAVLADYYVTGKINGVDQWFTSVGYVADLAMEPDTNDPSNKGKLLNLELKAGDQLCVIGKDGSWYHTSDGGDWWITEDGTYNVFLNGSGQVWVSPVVSD